MGIGSKIRDAADVAIGYFGFILYLAGLYWLVSILSRMLINNAGVLKKGLFG